MGLIGCIMCGFSVGIMRPGTISLSPEKFPAGGTAMFALLAMAGDLGAKGQTRKLACRLCIKLMGCYRKTQKGGQRPPDSENHFNILKQ